MEEDIFLIVSHFFLNILIERNLTYFFFFFFELEEMENCNLTHKNSANETRRRLTHENKLFEQEG